MKKVVVWALLCGVALGYMFFTQMTIGREDSKMKLMSLAFNNGDQLPKKYTCDGEDINPPLAWENVPIAWENVPKNAQSLVLVVDDPDAPATKPDSWVHWIVFNIPLTLNKLDENAAIDTIKGVKQGITDSKESKFHGACPPPGNGIHHYRFTLYALDTTLDLAEGVSKKILFSIMKDHILTQATLMATYERK